MGKIFRPGEIWNDTDGKPINAHGGGILLHNGVYYWFGEHKIEGRAGNLAHVGIHVYASDNLYDWRDRGIAFDIRTDGRFHPGECVVERPKVLFCEKTGEFVMWFHYESTICYQDAMSGVAVSKSPEGPFEFVSASRPNPGVWPLNTPDELRKICSVDVNVPCGENPLARKVNLLGAHFKKGQDARDMTLFLDDDGKAYHIFSSESNSTLHIAELSDDFRSHSGRVWRAFENRWMEAPAVFKHNGKYYIICSGCTGWAPNAARSAVADSISGPWTELGNPAVDEGGETTYRSQSTFVLPVGDRLVYAGDRWCPENASDGRYLWLPVEFENGRPVMHKPTEWSL